nr:MAG TPA: hypothetical protein [Caudoviricetes sp.]
MLLARSCVVLCTLHPNTVWSAVCIPTFGPQVNRLETQRTSNGSLHSWIGGALGVLDGSV